MKITLIRPNLSAARSADALEPVVFAILRGLTPPDVRCVLYDERLEDIPSNEPTDLVALTVETYTAKRAYQIAAEYLSRGIPVVMGGYHPSLHPEEALQYATSVVIGDAEASWPQLVEDARRGTLQRTYGNGLPELAGGHRDRSIFRGKRYRPVALVECGRGCRFSCDFCSIHALYGSHPRHRPLPEVVEEIRGLPHRHIAFTDDNLFNDADVFRELLAELLPLRVHWSCQASLDLAADESLVRLLARSGCTAVTIGFESLLDANLQQMHKRWNRHYGRYEDVIDVFHRHGIMVYGGFVLGYDHDTVESFERTLDFAIRSKLFLANFNPLTPTPGTPVYDRLKQEGRLIHDPWWLHADFRYGQAMFHPRRMTADELTHGCYRARTQFNRYGNILRRACEFRANLRSPYHAAVFLASNLTTRREIHRKQGRRLGNGTPLRPILAEVRT